MRQLIKNIIQEEFINAELDEKVARQAAQQLGYQILNKLGNGINATAYDIGDNKILKVTCSYRDARAFHRIKEVSNPYLPKVYDVKKLICIGEQYREREGYVIIAEKLQLIDGENRQTLINFLTTLKAKIHGKKALESSWVTTKDLTKPSNYKNRINNLKSKGFQKKLFTDLVRSAQLLEDNGLSVGDIHYENIGKNQHGNWVILDLGDSYCDWNFTVDSLDIV